MESEGTRRAFARFWLSWGTRFSASVARLTGPFSPDLLPSRPTSPLRGGDDWVRLVSHPGRRADRDWPAPERPPRWGAPVRYPQVEGRQLRLFDNAVMNAGVERLGETKGFRENRGCRNKAKLPTQGSMWRRVGRELKERSRQLWRRTKPDVVRLRQASRIRLRGPVSVECTAFAAWCLPPHRGFRPGLHQRRQRHPDPQGTRPRPRSRQKSGETGLPMWTLRSPRPPVL